MGEDDESLRKEIKSLRSKLEQMEKELEKCQVLMSRPNELSAAIESCSAMKSSIEFMFKGLRAIILFIVPLLAFFGYFSYSDIVNAGKRYVINRLDPVINSQISKINEDISTLMIFKNAFETSKGSSSNPLPAEKQSNQEGEKAAPDFRELSPYGVNNNKIPQRTAQGTLNQSAPLLRSKSQISQNK